MPALLGSAFLLSTTFVTPAAPKETALRGTDAALVAAGVASIPEAAHARLPEEFVIFAPIVDVLPILPHRPPGMPGSTTAITGSAISGAGDVGLRRENDRAN
ncbi:hypothetical protein AK812_SmicGene34722 [Symbiodinium microadriaticum]|uniref:Uncharacterized protein n=1 Tax=Symbiodinium microadriaticum TaxID=2951 RepID=A0A1Q9CND7_SYMMI|nr:hypothetical protein AK812_SmicGene34722 [Symbiodinium microadriaticum]